MSNPNHNPRSYDIHYLADAELQLTNLPDPGWILDVGGGGEGVIGQLEGSRVVAVDTSRRELEEAPPGPLKLVMDARDLQFLEESFSTVTCFFSLMYIPPAEHQLVLKEIYRVLKPGGTCILWEVDLPAREDSSPELVAIRLTLHLPDTLIETGYGTRWPSRRLGLDHYRDLTDQAGFLLKETWQKGCTFQLILQKPSAG